MNTREMTLPNFSLGWELEAIKRASRHVPGIECGHDGSVGGEALEYRIKKEHVYDPQKSLDCLRMLATDPDIEVNSSCGFHVHIGLGKRSRRLHEWAQWFVQLAREVETEAFQAVPSSRRESSYCRSWKRERSPIGNLSYDRNKMENRDRYNWVNPVEIFRPGGIRTVEIRLMGDTKRYTYLLAWVAVCRLMAQSSWALLSDASRLESEKHNIREALKLVREHFCMPGASKKSTAKMAVYLAAKARLSYPFGNPLHGLAETERTLRVCSQEAGTERWLTNYYAMEKAARDAARSGPPVTMEAGIAVGDTVLATRVDPDAGISIGNYYRVIGLNRGCHQNIRLAIGNSLEGWVVPSSCLRVADRVGGVPVCAG